MRRSLAFAVVFLVLGAASVPVGIAKAGGPSATPARQRGAGAPAPAFVTPPIFESTQVTLPGGASFDGFGTAVAVRGTTVFVGAPYVLDSSGSYVGAVYVLDHAGGGWVVQARLMPGDETPYGYFGSALAVEGGTLVVGAPGTRVGANDGQGAVYVFEESGGRWVQTARLSAPDGAAYDRLGWSVALSGTTMVAGAPDASIDGNYEQGAAYVFSRPDTVWAYDAKLVVEDGTPDDGFGEAVATSGGIVAIGAPQAGSYSGTVRAYVKAAGAWEQEAALVPGSAEGRFGAALNFTGDALLVGSPWADYSGAVFQYTRTDGVWSDATSITPAGSVSTFGASIARDGDLLVVAAPNTYIPGVQAPGSAHLFRLVDGTWGEQMLLAPSTHVHEAFLATALVDGEVVSGDPSATVGTHDFQGALMWWAMAPLVQAVTPRIAPTAGGTTVTLTGRYLMPGATVTIGGVPATDPTAVDPQTLTAVTPARPAGPADIVVTNTDGRASTLTPGLMFGNADLAVAALSVPSAVGTDVPMLVKATTRNTGKHPSVTTTTRFYLSSDAMLDANDVILASQKVPALSAGRAYAAWSSATVPRWTEAGWYYLFAVADVTGLVGELNETNNVRRVRLKVGCDVTVSNLAAPEKVRAGEGFRATVTTANLGPGPAADRRRGSTCRPMRSAAGTTGRLASASSACSTQGRRASGAVPSRSPTRWRRARIS